MPVRGGARSWGISITGIGEPSAANCELDRATDIKAADYV